MVQDSLTQHELLTDIQLYGKITGLTRKATMKAVKNKDTRIISILEDYLNEDTDENVDNIETEDNNIIESDEDDSDKENQHFILINPNRQTKPKGRPKGTKRIRSKYEQNVPTNNNRQYKCGLCGEMGHNKRNCTKS